MLIYESSAQKIRTLSKLGAEKIVFPPKSDRQRDICNYKVALLLITIYYTYDTRIWKIQFFQQKLY